CVVNRATSAAPSASASPSAFTRPHAGHRKTPTVSSVQSFARQRGQLAIVAHGTTRLIEHVTRAHNDEGPVSFRSRASLVLFYFAVSAVRRSRRTLPCPPR